MGMFSVQNEGWGEAECVESMCTCIDSHICCHLSFFVFLAGLHVNARW